MIKSEIEPNDDFFLFLEFLRHLNKYLAGYANLQHVKFGQKAIYLIQKTRYTSYVKKYIKRLIHLNVGKGKYEAIHWRRGDFEQACKKNKIYHNCWPKLEKIYEKSSSMAWILTNSKESEINELKSDGYIISLNGTINHIYNFFVDVGIMIGAQRFVGNQYSSISRNVFHIRSFLNKSCEYF